MVPDLTGTRSSRLLVLRLHEATGKDGKWICLCDCGTEVIRGGKGLRDGRNKSCGCLQRETIATIGRRPKPKSPCGTNAAYRRGCRCDLCVTAAKEHNRAEYRNNPERNAAHYLRNRERNAANPERYRDIRLAKYGLLHRQFLNILESQGSRCGCCGTTDPGHKKGWMVDHDHETGVIRGVLCAQCNVRLGQLGDNETGVIEWSQKMLAYLRRGIG